MAYHKVKTTVVERDGQELEYREEISPVNDLLLTRGLSFPNIDLMAGSSDPSIVGEDAPEGSFYLKEDNVVFKKIGPNPTDWAEETDTPKWVLFNPAYVKPFGQYVIHNRPLFVLNALYLDLGSDVIII